MEVQIHKEIRVMGRRVKHIHNSAMKNVGVSKDLTMECDWQAVHGIQRCRKPVLKFKTLHRCSTVLLSSPSLFPTPGNLKRAICGSKPHARIMKCC